MEWVWRSREGEEGEEAEGQVFPDRIPPAASSQTWLYCRVETSEPRHRVALLFC